VMKTGLLDHNLSCGCQAQEMTRQGHASDVMIPFISVTKSVTTWICLPYGFDRIMRIGIIPIP